VAASIDPGAFKHKSTPGAIWSLLAFGGPLTSEAVRVQLEVVFGRKVRARYVGQALAWLCVRGLACRLQRAYWEARWPLGQIGQGFATLPPGSPERVSQEDYLDLFQRETRG
jgi:hypothetical protein